MRISHFLALVIMSSLFLTAPGRNLAQKMDSAGMTDVRSKNPDILVSLMYSRPDNFTGAVIYTDGSIDNSVYLHPKAAQALLKAARNLHAERPELRLLVKDASRPMSAQRRMYAVVRGTSKAPYVSNPANGGGLHNYGLAVDITLADSLGREIPMGTPVDHLGPEAHIDKEDALVRTKVITRRQRDNRILLRRIMTGAGFTPLRTEWWHFNLVSRPVARRSYSLLDF